MTPLQKYEFDARLDFAKAWSEGKPMERSWKDGEWNKVTCVFDPRNFFDADCKFRVAPTAEETRIATYQKLYDEWNGTRCVMEWKRVEAGCDWDVDTNPQTTFERLIRGEKHLDIRKKPVPTIVPWTTQTCPVGTVVRPKGAQSRCLITHAGIKMFMTGDGSEHLYEIALRTWETESGQPCGTPEATE